MIPGKIGGYVVFEAAFANVVQEFLHVRDFDDAGATEGVEWIVGESALADVAAHFSCGIVGGEASEAHFFGLDEADAGAECVFFADGAGDDFLEVHFHGAEEVFGQIGAVEADCLVGIGSVIIVPVEEGRWRVGRELQGMHSEDAADVDLAGAGEEFVAHHAHDGAGDDAKIFFDGGPTLDGADGDFGCGHPVVDDCA